MNTVQILTRAKNLVAKKWTQGSYLTKGAMCMAGGIGVAMGAHKSGHPLHLSPSEVAGITKGDLLASNTALKYLAHAVGSHEGCSPINDVDADSANENLSVITSWNDEDFRKKSEVVSAFDRAIKMAKRRHVRG